MGLYVHIPWCVRKCPYCDFNSHAVRQASLPESEYVQCLLSDLETELQRACKPIATVYFGGGTPSLFQPKSFEQILDHPVLQRAVEKTIEVNPGTIEFHRLKDYVSAGLNRLSMGVQSLDDTYLHALGRIHSARDVRERVDEAHQAGFRSINLDLMYGLPDQPFPDAVRDLEALIELEPDHISWYQLTIEPNTTFYTHPPTLASDNERADMSDSGVELLAAAGFNRYEVSAFCKPNHQCRHNLLYWRFEDYLGIGAGAHGKLSLQDGTIIRTRKRKQPEGYMADQSSIDEAVKPTDLPIEFMMNALRLRDGIEEAQFTKTTGLDLGLLRPTLRLLRSEGLMNESSISLTDRGYNFLDSVVGRFAE